MPKLPILSGSDVVKVLSKMGYSHMRTRGSHAIMKKQTAERSTTIPVPLHKELAKGTLKSIMRQTGIDLERLLGLI